MLLHLMFVLIKPKHVQHMPSVYCTGWVLSMFCISVLSCAHETLASFFKQYDVVYDVTVFTTEICFNFAFCMHGRSCTKNGTS